MARIDKIKEALAKMQPEDKIDLWNERCSEEGFSDDQIYENDEEFFNMFYPNDSFGAVQRAIYGDYNPMNDFVTLDGYANFKSFDVSRLKNFISDDEIAEYLDKKGDLDDLDIEDEEENEVSEDRYYEMLEVLPPLYFKTLNGKKVSGGFAVSEPTNHIQTDSGYKAVYNGFYTEGDKYFEIGGVYFTETDSDGEVDEYGGNSQEAKTVDPDAFAKGGGVRKDFFTGREYSYGRNWTNDHRHHNKSEDYEVPTAKRKRKFALGGGTDGLDFEDIYHQEVKKWIEQNAPSKYHNTSLDEIPRNVFNSYQLRQVDSFMERFDSGTFAKGGGVRMHNGREYSIGRNWTNDHRHNNKSEDYEVPMADRKRQYGIGGGLKKATYIPNRDIDSLKTNYGQTIAGKNLLDGAYAKSKVKKPKMARTQFEDETYEYGTGGTMDSSTFKKGGTPKKPIAFESSNLYFNGYAMDINGNKVVRVSFPTGRAFSIQTLGTLPKTYKAHATIGFDEAEINSYVKEFGSPAQKKKLKIYKK